MKRDYNDSDSHVFLGKVYHRRRQRPRTLGAFDLLRDLVTCGKTGHKVFLMLGQAQPEIYTQLGLNDPATRTGAFSAGQLKLIKI
jgi:hypothetical protein